MGAAKGIVNYRFDGHFCNQNSFHVHHKNRHVPIQGSLTGSFKTRLPSARLGYPSRNDQAIVFLSNGPELAHDEFVIEISKLFVNTGSISIFGTKNHLARLRILELPSGGRDWFNRVSSPLMRGAFVNSAYILLENAVLCQQAEIHERSKGCICIAEGSQLIANTKFTMNLQDIFFHPGVGEAALLIQAEGRQNAEYNVVNFPRGSYIKLNRDFAEVRILDGQVLFLSGADDGNVTIKFRGLQMSRHKFVFKDRMLTFEEGALLNHSPSAPCGLFYTLYQHVHEYEIEV